MPGAKVFSKLDAISGYWQLKLDEESSKLCTFNTPFGRYRFLHVPFGIVSASEIFQRVMSQMVEDIDGSEAIMDDIVVWGKDQAEHDMCLKQVMGKAKARGLKFNKGKCKFRQNQISYRSDMYCLERVWKQIQRRSEQFKTWNDRRAREKWWHFSDSSNIWRNSCPTWQTSVLLSENWQRRMLSGSGLRPKRTVSTNCRNWQQKLQYSGSMTLHYLSHSQSTRHLQVLVVSSCRKANQ